MAPSLMSFRHGSKCSASSSRRATCGSVRACPSRPPLGTLYTAQCFAVAATFWDRKPCAMAVASSPTKNGSCQRGRSRRWVGVRKWMGCDAHKYAPPRVCVRV